MKSVLIYTVHKAASMFLHKLAIDASEEFGIAYYSVNFDRYYDEIIKSSWKTFIEDESKQGCFGPIRAGETKAIFPKPLSEYSIVLHLRDPRDVLTSLFFSSTFSHKRLPGRFNPDDELRKKWEEAGIDNYVLEYAPSFKERYQDLITTLLDKDNVRFIKYEDMVSNYSEWLEGFLSAFSHLDVPRVRKKGLLRWPNSIHKIHRRLSRKYKNEFKAPESEDIYSHKRQIMPGDYKSKLKPGTIDVLNREFGDILKALSYN